MMSCCHAVMRPQPFGAWQRSPQNPKLFLHGPLAVTIQLMDSVHLDAAVAYASAEIIELHVWMPSQDRHGNGGVGDSL